MNITAVVSAVATVAWLVVVVLIGVAVLRATRGQPFRGIVGGMIAGVVIALVASSASAGLVFIQPNERAVVISAVQARGYRSEALTPGLRWIFPFAETIQRYSISQQTYTMSIAPLEGQVQGDDSVSARTSDVQEVLIDSSVIFSVNPTRVIDIHIRWQNRYEVGFVRPQARGIIRDEAAKFGVEEIVSGSRDELTAGIRDKLDEKLASEGLILVDFVLRNIQFTPEFAAQVEQKQIEEQKKLQAEFTVGVRQQEALQAIALAEGQKAAAILEAEGLAEARVIQALAEKEALELIASALRDNPDLITFEYVQRLAPGIRVMLVPSDNPFLIPIPSLDGSTTGTTTIEPTAP